MNYLIKQNGEAVECLPGATHEITCKILFKYSLPHFLEKLRGVRVRMYGGYAAIESYDSPTNEQRIRINSILRQSQIFELFACFRGIGNEQSNFPHRILNLKI